MSVLPNEFLEVVEVVSAIFKTSKRFVEFEFIVNPLQKYSSSVKAIFSRPTYCQHVQEVTVFLRILKIQPGKLMVFLSLLSYPILNKESKIKQTFQAPGQGNCFIFVYCF